MTKPVSMPVTIETGIEFTTCCYGSDWADTVRQVLEALPPRVRELIRYPDNPVFVVDGTTLTLLVRQYSLNIARSSKLGAEVAEILDTFVRGEVNAPLMLTVNNPSPFRREAAARGLMKPRLVLIVKTPSSAPKWLEEKVSALADAMAEDDGEERFELRRRERPDITSIFPELSGVTAQASA